MSLNIGCTALLLGAALLLAVPAISTAQDFASIDAKNRDSIVFVHSKKFRKDGAGVPRDSYGTGFIISPLGYVLTAGHVLLDEDNDSIVETRVAVRTRRGQMYRVEPVKKDSELDLALLLLPDAGIAWRSVSWGNDKQVPLSAPLFALGFPNNADLAPATGVLSNRGGPKGRWQTTLLINHGQSGGPVFDVNGNVVAIATAGNDYQQGVTFAIPRSYALGLTQLAELRLPLEPIFATLPNAQLVSQNFSFYKSVDHQERTNPTERYCLPEGFVVQQVSPTVTTEAGPGTRLVSVNLDPKSRNCVELVAIVQGAGVDKIGPIIVNYRGRGWLGANISVTGVREQK